MYEFDDSAAAIGVFLLTIVLVVMFYIATPAKSQEAPPCGRAVDLHKQLEKHYGETVTAGGIVGTGYLEILTSKAGTFTIIMRRLDGTGCIVAGGKGFALADRAPMKENGL